MGISIAMVLVGEQARVSVEAVTQKLQQQWADDPPATEISQKESVASFQWGEATVFLAEMPAPFPWSDLEGPCATAILWPDATAELRHHKTHWLVTLNDDAEPLESAAMLTKVTAAFMAVTPETLGVYWGNATMVIRKDIFIDFAEDVLPEGPPLHIWVDFRVGKETPKTSSGFTCGMKALGHMEFEAKGSPEPPVELRDRFMGLANYVLENGPVIQDGNTIGQDANEKIRVIYSKSEFGHQEQVMRLFYEKSSPASPWWKVW